MADPQGQAVEEGKAGRRAGPSGWAERHRGEAASAESVRQSERSGEAGESHRAAAPAGDPDKRAGRCAHARPARRPEWPSPRSGLSTKGAASFGSHERLVVGTEASVSDDKNHPCHRTSVECPGRAPRELVCRPTADSICHLPQGFCFSVPSNSRFLFTSRLIPSCNQRARKALWSIEGFCESSESLLRRPPASDFALN
jgi:hypothetical protein